MQVKFKATKKGEQPKLFTQLPHLLEYFTKHPLEKHPYARCFFSTKSVYDGINLLTQLKSLRDEILLRKD